MDEFYQYPHKPVDYLRDFLKKLSMSPITSGALLVFCAILSLIWANSGWSDSYFALLTTHLTIGIGDHAISKPLLFWINDGLMVIFFFAVGLEIKHEVLEGHLSTWKKASLPLIAAAGGMILPALIFTVFNFGTEAMRGWGIPVATDIAFAVGILALLGKRVPPPLRIALLALAIADDLGAIIVIAVFYTEHLSIVALLLGFVGLGILWAGNRFLGIRTLGFYFLFGVLVWVAFLNSGVHPTVAGVLVAFTIPHHPPLPLRTFFRDTQQLLSNFGKEESPELQFMLLDKINEGSFMAESTLRRAERGLYNWVNFFIMPLFALFNAGVKIPETGFFSELTTPITLGVMLGLFLGKQFGVLGASWLAAKIGIAQLPESLRWREFYGMAMLSGIGFTMSLFIASLAYANHLQFLNEAKIGILTGSLLSALAGLLYLHKVLPKLPSSSEEASS